MEILIKGTPEVIADLAGSLHSLTIMNDVLLDIESVEKIDITYDKDVIIINLD
jgi:hypothetical protein